ncbi:M23 family metallopeptidase [Pseudodesulfovibrio thermohalotolerans]|uniref:M23 family metallopeptidase n=1 Tax=Pseudodesulfovibrio thermohalotolerans TaxID=2880651 RepID=UPI0024414A02|nr:M23 family metallopeptidase [Pseudodesulfovibrio thermohalotolerans]WFS63247.1 M23 family metallopeptidase [Pseudodesulfovibrio thermohalotolerans]
MRRFFLIVFLTALLGLPLNSLAQDSSFGLEEGDGPSLLTAANTQAQPVQAAPAPAAPAVTAPAQATPDPVEAEPAQAAPALDQVSPPPAVVEPAPAEVGSAPTADVSVPAATAPVQAVAGSAPDSVEPVQVKPVPALVLAAPRKAGVGKPFLVRLTSDLPMESVLIRWQGREVVPSISVWNDRHVALAMLGTDVLTERPGKEELVVVASVAGKENTLRRTVRIAPEDYPKQELTLPEKMVSPPKEVHDRIAAERSRTTAAKDTVSARRMWRLPLERPVQGKILSVYGAQRILNGKPKNPHRGLDFRSPMGNPVKCVDSGRVILVGDHYYAGNSVYVDHGNGVVSMYFHLSEPTVKEGDEVRRGQTIGLTGMTGRATGPHLHFSLSVQGDLVDPAPLFTSTADKLLR